MIRKTVGCLFVLALLASCAAVETARNFAGDQLGRAVEVECALSPEQRQRNLEAINNGLEARGAVFRATALDCDGNGAPDF